MQPNVKSFKEGEVIFNEGDRGREMYIVKEGEIAISRSTKDGNVELARLKPGSALGEMSLLDNLPRSASATASMPTKITVINELVFNTTMQKVPPWLSSIVRIITSRIRDANKRVGQSILRNREGGVASLIYLLLDKHKKIVGGKPALEHDLVVLEAFYTCRLGKTTTNSILEGLIKREMLEIDKDHTGKQFVFIRDLEVLSLFVEFQKLKERGRTFTELSIPDNEVDLLNNIAYVSQKSGTETHEGTELPLKAFMEDIAEKNMQGIEKMLSDLQRRDILSLAPNEDGSDSIILFQREMLSRIRKVREWVDRFSKDTKE